MSSPRSIIWLVTGRCNLACSHCYAQRFVRRRGLAPEQARDLIAQAASVGVRHIGLAGGEPLMREDVLETWPKSGMKRGYLLYFEETTRGG